MIYSQMQKDRHFAKMPSESMSMSPKKANDMDQAATVATMEECSKLQQSNAFACFMKTVKNKLAEYVLVADDNELKVFSASNGNEKAPFALKDVHATVEPMRVAVTGSQETHFSL